MTFDIRRGEIAFLRDENYNTGRRLHECFLGDRGWTSGFFRLNGRPVPARRSRPRHRQRDRHSD